MSTVSEISDWSLLAELGPLLQTLAPTMGPIGSLGGRLKDTGEASEANETAEDSNKDGEGPIAEL